MRILHAQNSPYYPAHGGGDRSNRLLLEALAARGHECTVVARTGGYGAQEHERYLRDLARRNVAVQASASGVVAFTLNGVGVSVMTNNPNLRGYFTSQISEFKPDVIITSTDDPAQLLLEAALRDGHARVVYLVRATLAVPFGPDCAFPSAAKTGVLRNVDAAVGVSRYVADYIRRWGGIEAVHVPISLLEKGPWHNLGRYENEFVTLVNPCAVKGISIFLALAARMPEVQFAAVPTWGTNERDRAALRGHANVQVLDPVDNIDDLLVRTRALLVPSLWAEARSRIVLEAMLRGIPVLASNVGGIPEAKMGVPYLLPVKPIEKYQPRLDEQMVPVAEVPEQDTGPWQAALAELLSSRERYEQISSASRDAALKYASSLSVEPFETLLQETLRKNKRAPLAAPEPQPVAPEGQSVLDALSPEKRQLLALRLRKKAAALATPWFPSLDPDARGKLRLFCFPHAGGGAATFQRWAESLPGSVSLTPVRYPGREARIAERPFESMQTLVAALGEAIAPWTAQPFAFFGHSMGAGVAFELARHLRRRAMAGPVALFVSGARAPRFRFGLVPPPEPGEAEFLDQLKRLEGIPAEVLENPDMMRVILPALRADARLYRTYVYEEEAPLACPVYAYGGAEDSNVRREHLEAWAKETAGAFSLRMFPGGHFFLQSCRGPFLEALAADLEKERD